MRITVRLCIGAALVLTLAACRISARQSEPAEAGGASGGPPDEGCFGVGTPSGESLRYKDGTEVCLTREEMDRIPLLVKKGNTPETTRVETDWLGRKREVTDTGDNYIDYRDVAEYLRRQGKEVDLSRAATPEP